MIKIAARSYEITPLRPINDRDCTDEQLLDRYINAASEAFSKEVRRFSYKRENENITAIIITVDNPKNPEDIDMLALELMCGAIEDEPHNDELCRYR
jgi:hypothetical protein